MEMQPLEIAGFTLTKVQRAQILQEIFGVAKAQQDKWPGFQAFLGYIEERFAVTGPECFTPLWSILSRAVPVTAEDILEFTISIVAVLRDAPKEGMSIDEILQSILVPLERDLDRLGVDIANASRHAVFMVLSWLTMIYEASGDKSNGRFRIKLPLQSEGVREEQNMDNASRPLSRLLRGFGQLLPSTEVVLAAIEKPTPDLIYANNLNMFSLKLINKIRIEWTNSLGCHLMFSPLSRTLSIFRFPSFCAITCETSTGETAIDKYVLYYIIQLSIGC